MLPDTELKMEHPLKMEHRPAEAVLAVGGIHCASCVQLICIRVGELPGVDSITVSQATHRARVIWDAARSSLQDVIAAIARAGYQAWPVGASGASPERSGARRAMLWRLFVAGFSMMQVMMYAFPAYVAGAGDIEPDIDALLKIAAFILTVPVMAYSAAPFLQGAFRDLRLRRVGMDVPVALAILITFGCSVWNTFIGDGPVYYDSVTMFVFLLLAGRYLEGLARERALNAVEQLTRLQPARADRMVDYPASSACADVAVESLRQGDLVLVRVGATAPADGIVVAGESLNDESLLTGESSPVTKSAGASVIGGATNLSAPLVLRITATGAASRLSTIVRLVEQAADQKPMLVQLADRHAGRFLACVIALAAMAGLFWLRVDAAQAVWVAVAVLIVTCPCALSLATPLALSAATGNLALRGMLSTRGHALEALARADHFVFDKTGTLTTGRMQVLSALLLGDLDRNALDLTAGRLEQWAVHPIAQALAMVAAPAMLKGAPAEVTGYRETPGSGVEGRVDGELLRIGSIDFVQQLHGKPLPPGASEFVRQAQTIAAVGNSHGWLGMYCLGDGIRAGSSELVASLKRDGCQVTLLTGDNAQVGNRVGAALGIADIRSAMSPEAKRDVVAALQARGAVVAMVGDGVNDAPVLAQAHVSIAMGSGSPLAQSRSDMVLMSASPADFWYARQVAIKTMAIVRQNLIWGAAYNLVAIPLATGGALSPWMAGLGMTASSLVVVANSLRLLPRQPVRTAVEPDIAAYAAEH